VAAIAMYIPQELNSECRENSTQTCRNCLCLGGWLAGWLAGWLCNQTHASRPSRLHVGNEHGFAAAQGWPGRRDSSERKTVGIAIDCDCDCDCDRDRDRGLGLDLDVDCFGVLVQCQ
jgi:hypothetical protein